MATPRGDEENKGKRKAAKIKWYNLQPIDAERDIPEFTALLVLMFH